MTCAAHKKIQMARNYMLNDRPSRFLTIELSSMFPRSSPRQDRTSRALEEEGFSQAEQMCLRQKIEMELQKRR